MFKQKESYAVTAVVVVSLIIAMAIWSSPTQLPDVRIAFIGNSMQYYNDFPRFMQALSDNHIQQDCCLHGDATLSSILVWGSGTYAIWQTGVARDDGSYIVDDDLADNETEAEDLSSSNGIIWDMGACTVPSLIYGRDDNLEARMEENGYNDDGGYESALNDDFLTYNDGKNPCLRDPSYFEYRQAKVASRSYNTTTSWDYIIMNDNTRAPARNVTRQESLQTLQESYIPMFLDSGATPILLMTHAYETPYRDMSGLIDVPTFTSLTYEGYKEYAELLQEALPQSQEPRIAPVGLAFLMVWEENYNLWLKLFHVDHVHASPHGTFLQGCVMHYVIYGRMPNPKIALRDDMSALWDHARRLQPRQHRRLPMPTKQEAEYLYHIAERVMKYHQKPQSFILYENKESSTYVPNDALYSTNDIY